MNKAEKAFKAKQVEFTSALKTFAMSVNEIPFTFPQVKEQSGKAYSALVDLSEAIQGIGK